MKIIMEPNAILCIVQILWYSYNKKKLIVWSILWTDTENS